MNILGNLTIRFVPTRDFEARAPFARLVETTAPTFLDTTSGNDAFEYEVTGVMN